jgi:hypothetical protein
MPNIRLLGFLGDAHAHSMEFLEDLFGAAFLLLYGVFVLTAIGLLLVIPLAALVFTIMDIFNRDDIAAGKLVWLLVVLLAPLIGLAAYWIAKPASDQASATASPVRQGVATSEARTSPGAAPESLAPAGQRT